MKKLVTCVLALGVFCVATKVNAQEMPMPSASDEHKIVVADAGTWDITGKIFMGPDNTTEIKGHEKVVAVGEFWTVSHFKGEFMGTKFNGSGTNGYDPKTKKFVGTWVDSMNPHATRMSGSYDKETKTLTYETKSVDMMGNDAKGKIVIVLKDENTREFTMYSPDPTGGDELVKSMEMTYTRAKDE